MEPSSGGQPGRSRRPSRRALLLAGLAGGTGVAAVPVTELIRGLTQPAADFDDGIIARTYSFNAGWLFGGRRPGAGQLAAVVRGDELLQRQVL